MRLASSKAKSCAAQLFAVCAVIAANFGRQQTACDTPSRIPSQLTYFVVLGCRLVFTARAIDRAQTRNLALPVCQKGQAGSKAGKFPS